jgi:hypothetical protein
MSPDKTSAFGHWRRVIPRRRGTYIITKTWTTKPSGIMIGHLITSTLLTVSSWWVVSCLTNWLIGALHWYSYNSRLETHHVYAEDKTAGSTGTMGSSLCCKWLLYVPPGLTLTNSTFCPHSVLICSVGISEQIATLSLYSINWLVFITETGCVYCAVRTESFKYNWRYKPVLGVFFYRTPSKNWPASPACTSSSSEWLQRTACYSCHRDVHQRRRACGSNKMGNLFILPFSLVYVNDVLPQRSGVK